MNPYAEDEMALIVPVFHPMAQAGKIQCDDLYKLKFIALDAQSTIRKVIDKVLSRSNIDPRLLKVEMELNSIEAIKNAVQAGLGVAFLSILAVEKDLEFEIFKRVAIENVVVKRPLSLVLNPSRYQSKAAEMFIDEVLPKLFQLNSHLHPLLEKKLEES